MVGETHAELDRLPPFLAVLARSQIPKVLFAPPGQPVVPAGVDCDISVILGLREDEWPGLILELTHRTLRNPVE